jgi:hypothetical protein
MAITVNIYEENTIRQLAAYGLVHQDYSTVWKNKYAGIFVMLCTTDVAAYSSSFVGTVEQLLATGVQELAGGGYSYIPAPNKNSGVFYISNNDYYSGVSGRSEYIVTVPTTGAKFVPQWTRYERYGNVFIAESFTLQPAVRWYFSSTVSFKSALVCLELPVKTPGATIYQRSYPLAMIDFGATISRAQGSGFHIVWSESGLIAWTR